MAKQQERTAAMQAVVDEVARKLRVWLDGSADASAALSFEAIEEFGVEVGDAVARAVMQRTLERQASESMTEVCRCGAPLEPRDPECHELLTRRGPVGWEEPVGYCSRCRRDFFPSLPEAGSAAG
jgi:hypothetical protein